MSYRRRAVGAFRLDRTHHPFTIVTKIQKLKDNKSPGIGGITPKVLKEIAEEISVPLAILFNLSLREGTVPHEWKHANVVPIFKNGNRCKAEQTTDR